MGKALTEIKISGLPEDISYAWLLLNGEEFDLIKDGSTPGDYYLDVECRKLDGNDTDIKVIILRDNQKIMYQY